MLTPSQTTLASSAVRELRVALSNYFLYAVGNDMIQKSIDRFLGSLELLFQDLPSVGLGESEGRLLAEGSPLDERMTGSTNMIKDLFLTHKIQTLAFQKGVEAVEIKALFELLKPKALPTGLSLVQALVQKPLPHIRLNEKVYVAIKEGEKVVTREGLPPGEENLQEALEALQYFLQIFSRVRPESTKREVARKMIDNMGGWLVTGEPGAGPGTAGGGKGGGVGGQPLLEVMGGLVSLKQSLASLKDPGQIKNAQISMDEVLKKLVLLAESQGVGAEAATALGAASSESQGSLFEANSVLGDLRAGKFECLWDPSLERQVDETFSILQEPQEADGFEAFWEEVWKKVLAGNLQEQTLALRHLNRLRWKQITRPLQLEALRNMEKFLVECPHPATYPIALTLVQDWLPQEVDHPDWGEFLETTRVLQQAAGQKPQLFEKQNLAAQAALETVFCWPVLERILAVHTKLAKDKVMSLLSLLGPLASEFLLEKTQRAAAESPEWKAAVDLLSGMEAGGKAVFEPWIREKGEGADLGRFLEIFKRVPLPGHLADYFEKHWGTLAAENQAKILEVAEMWKRADFRPMLLRLMDHPDRPIAAKALQVLAKVGLEGDSRAIVAAVKNYPEKSGGRDRFWAAACLALGELGDPLGMDPLMEWADKYKFLQSKKERSLEVRRAAIEGLGYFRSNLVKTFLASLQKDAEKELKAALERSLKSIDEKLSRPQDSQEA